MEYQSKTTAVTYSKDEAFLMLPSLYFREIILVWRTTTVPRDILPAELRKGQKLHSDDILTVVQRYIKSY